MNKEAFCVSYDKINYHAPIPQGQDIERIQRTREHRIEENILRYLGEYRLGVKFDEIFYKKERDVLTGKAYLSSGDNSPIRDVFRKAIRAREQKGLSVRREIAECIGFEKLEQQLLKSSENSLFVWVSPPGSRSDGYGNYSFTFVGQKINDPTTNEEIIRVIPYRNILSVDEHKAYLVGFDKMAEDFNSDIDFLRNPIVVPPTKFMLIPEDILNVIGEHEEFSTAWLLRLKKEIDAMIKRYIDLVKIGVSDEDLTKVKYAIENYTIVNQGKVSTHDLERTIEIFGNYTPPKAAGSCGSSSSATLMGNHEESNKTWEYHLGDCVVCGSKKIEVGPCSICKECEKKFDQEEGRK